MDIRIDWSPEAVEDLGFISEYIARDSEFYAGSVVSKILNVTRNIASFPLIGREVPETKSEYVREIFIYNYRLIYKFENNSILIIAIIHGKRQFENILGRLK